MLFFIFKTILKNYILLNNVGIGKLIKLVDSTAEDYKEIMDTNVYSLFIFFSKYVVEDMLKRKERRNE